MPVYQLTRDLVFPSPEAATEEGIVAVGGDVSPERLLLAYSQGIFPWPVQGFPLLWFSPDPRFVLRPSEAHLSRSLRRRMRRGEFEVRADCDFAGVIAGCAAVPRIGQAGTWITPELRRGFTQLHELGYAHSIEAYQGGVLQGGLYGVSLGTAFFGESMFARSADASKVAFATLLGNLVQWGFTLVDCQVHTEHLERFGATSWPRQAFLSNLHRALSEPTRRGRWELPLDPAAALDRLDPPASSAADG